MINEKYANRMVEVQTTRERELRSAIDAHDRRMAELKSMSETGYPKLEEKYKAYKERVRTEHESAWSALAARWRDGLNQAAAELAAVIARSMATAPNGTTRSGSRERCRNWSHP